LRALSSITAIAKSKPRSFQFRAESNRASFPDWDLEAATSSILAASSFVLEEIQRLVFEAYCPSLLKSPSEKSLQLSPKVNNFLGTHAVRHETVIEAERRCGLISEVI
jgi:hypothetical protein